MNATTLPQPPITMNPAVDQPPRIFCLCGMGPLVGQEIATGLCYACVAALLANKAVGR